jgi:hypothetical protein
VFVFVVPHVELSPSLWIHDMEDIHSSVNFYLYLIYLIPDHLLKFVVRVFQRYSYFGRMVLHTYQEFEWPLCVLAVEMK